ncbi:secretin N-terminal domain-containing protein [Neorhodopirellula lusitana]|uniref:secretin N-terminal domain-containing protein n=1 Tax=Neorhodopirellula lusitana TaxID=445327 RepID=UPI00384F34F9
MPTDGTTRQTLSPPQASLRRVHVTRQRRCLRGILLVTMCLPWSASLGLADDAGSVAYVSPSTQAAPSAGLVTSPELLANPVGKQLGETTGDVLELDAANTSGAPLSPSLRSAGPVQVLPSPRSEFGQTQPEASASELISHALDQRGSITFRKTSLQEVVFVLSDLWKINIVAGEKVTGTVSGVFNDAPLRDVLSAILTSSGYGYTAAGNSLIVLPQAEVGTSNPEFRPRTIPFAISDETQRNSTLEAAKMLLSDRGRIQAFGAGSVLVIDTPERVDLVEEMFVASGVGGRLPNGGGANVAGGLWAPLRIVYFTPQYTEASEMAESLANAIGGTTGTNNSSGGDGGGSGGGGSNSMNDGPVVAVYAQENRIMVRGTPEELSLASEAFQQLDVPRAQVRITAMIYDVGLKELEELGVDWSRNFRLNTVDSTPLSEFTGNISEAVGFSSGGTSTAASIGLRTLSSNFDASAFLNALDATTEAKLLADPSITTADRREASIKIVQQIPIIAATPSTETSVVYAQVEFRDAGIILKVTPRISHDQTIEMKVEPEYSVVTSYINDNPVIDTRTAETTVRVKNGTMFVLGGLRQKTLTETVAGVPYLRDLKYVGKLFRNHTTEVRESELIVFLKPELINPTYTGKPREQIAARVSNHQLDSIAYATCCPLSPACCDPMCPNHNPRARVNGGSHELRMIGENGITPFQLAYPESHPEVIAEETILSDSYEMIPLPTSTVQ